MARILETGELPEQQKARGQRIDHWYYKKSHPWRTRKFLLSMLFPILGIGIVLAFTYLPFGDNAFLPGPVSTKHHLFGHRCDECHEQGKDKDGQPSWGKVTDQKCLACHDGPLHKDNMVFHGENVMKDKAGNDVQTPTCASCHVEHKGAVFLTQIADRHCTQCHADLKVSKGAPQVTVSIRSFNDGHPEWKLLRDKEKDKTPFIFPHDKHLSGVKWGKDAIETRKGVDKEFFKAPGASMACSDCHVQDSDGRYMKSTNFEKHCMSCHALDMNIDTGGVGVIRLPHGTPDLAENAVAAAITKKFIETGGAVPEIEK